MVQCILVIKGSLPVEHMGNHSPMFLCLLWSCSTNLDRQFHERGHLSICEILKYSAPAFQSFCCVSSLLPGYSALRFFLLTRLHFLALSFHVVGSGYVLKLAHVGCMSKNFISIHLSPSALPQSERGSTAALTALH